MTLSNSSIIFKPMTHDIVQEFEPKTIPCFISVPIALLYSDRLIPVNMIRDTVFMKHVCTEIATVFWSGYVFGADFFTVYHRL